MINNVTDLLVLICAFPECALFEKPKACCHCLYSYPLKSDHPFIHSFIHAFMPIFPDTEGLVAEISITASDGIQGIIGWQNIEYELPFCLFSTIMNYGISQRGINVKKINIFNVKIVSVMYAFLFLQLRGK